MAIADVCKPEDMKADPIGDLKVVGDDPEWDLFIPAAEAAKQLDFARNFYGHWKIISISVEEVGKQPVEFAGRHRIERALRHLNNYPEGVEVLVVVEMPDPRVPTSA
ncbi:hypothetical protein COT78_00360 [Candidatus Berkelbacteria bacterium CG10_big_fil_rev_8_21_14_0_10_43_13]|uniref:Uncharacterized protein n=1 Tax=Candidatus Berkelbacteria bacterium CG10_big_fil_rev_8_21_14_0_10_43_13 TaxID=1974514 RepID=A0A2H0W7F6_9BACT|nr:MAG: hypothetical protein COT78_00360 [Candidatus Berkelbacteria bacterium CG10_big_fil_rev_8_21_14_0_10_43_13]